MRLQCHIGDLVKQQRTREVFGAELAKVFNAFSHSTRTGFYITGRNLFRIREYLKSGGILASTVVIARKFVND